MKLPVVAGLVEAAVPDAAGPILLEAEAGAEAVRDCPPKVHAALNRAIFAGERRRMPICIVRQTVQNRPGVKRMSMMGRRPAVDAT